MIDTVQWIHPTATGIFVEFLDHSIPFTLFTEWFLLFTFTFLWNEHSVCKYGYEWTMVM